MSELLTDLSGPIARITLNRPERHNCFDDALIAELTEAFERAGEAHAVRVVVIDAKGRSFCAGADLAWMQRVSILPPEENRQDAARLARMLQVLNELPKPTLAVVQGPSFGGGVGLVSCCDLVLAADTATFALSEVKIGIVPATISPYVVAAIGPRQARRYMLTAERFGAAEAQRLGLVHIVEPLAALEAEGQRLAQALLQNGPEALRETKALLREVAGQPIDEELIDFTVQRIAVVRAGPEAREGVAAFLEKRKPAWQG